MHVKYFRRAVYYREKKELTGGGQRSIGIQAGPVQPLLTFGRMLGER